MSRYPQSSSKAIHRNRIIELSIFQCVYALKGMFLSNSGMRHNLSPATTMPDRKQSTTAPTFMLHILEPRREIRDAATASAEAA